MAKCGYGSYRKTTKLSNVERGCLLLGLVTAELLSLQSAFPAIGGGLEARNSRLSRCCTLVTRYWTLFTLARLTYSSVDLGKLKRAPLQLTADVTYSLGYKTLTNLNYCPILLVSSHFHGNGCKEHRCS
ncbi:hypothetical protein J6590_088565 [Homalodisca vitripennis]|nr:hypothetical protein J6590_088565 [Homalodisca vitripennis]